jgi:hypothetical protein
LKRWLKDSRLVSTPPIFEHRDRFDYSSRWFDVSPIKLKPHVTLRQSVVAVRLFTTVRERAVLYDGVEQGAERRKCFVVVSARVKMEVANCVG